MKKIKSTLKNRFAHLAYFYSYLREKVFIAIVLNIIVGFLDGLGLSMFLPLLQVADGTGQANASSMGHLGFLVSFLQKGGLVVTMQLALMVIVVFFVLKGVVYYIKGVYQVKLQQYFIREIRLKSIQHLSNLSYTHFVKSDVGNIQNALTGEVDKVSKACQFYFQAFQHGVLVLVYIGFAFAVDWKFAIMVSIGGLFSDLVYRKIYKKTKEVSKKLSEDNGAFQGLIQEFVSCFKYLKATAGIGQYQKKLIDQVDVIEKNNSKIGVLSVLLSATREPLSIIVVAVVIFLQTTIFHTYLTAILISLLFFYRALGSLMQFQVSWNSFLGLAGSIEHLEAFAQELASGRELYRGKKTAIFNREIIFKGVSFGYQEHTVLKNISFEIYKNETLALVGESGSGKSTLVNMISGLLNAGNGKICIDGADLQDIDVRALRSRIGYITQEPVIFNDTVYNNVTLWSVRTAENLSRFEEACKQAAIWDFVLSAPNGLNTELGNAGINLSGGQRQRISIARELYKEVDLLILDEATSALDSSTEQLIQKSMEALKGKVTLIVIAHRLSTIKQADRIVLLKKGEIMQIDGFSELVASNRAFKSMVEQQVI